MEAKIKQALSHVHQAIKNFNSVEIVCAWSGGNDSSVTTHMINNHADQFDIPVSVMSANTFMAADGWREWTSDHAAQMGWHHKFYDGEFDQWVEFVQKSGCPRTRTGHSWTFNYLKGRAFRKCLKDVKSRHKHLKNNPEKSGRHNTVLFISGVYQLESDVRNKAELVSKIDSAVWVNPCLYWSKSDFIHYRHDNELPENPFYETVGGSGDCQCNWGNFITLRKLQKHSPILADGNVALIDKISRDLHGYGWDGTPAGQTEMFSAFEDEGKLLQMDSPFLCSTCSRSKPKIHEAEQLALMRDIF